jgi:hypothetical protein
VGGHGHRLGIQHRIIIAGDGPLLATLRELLPDAVFTGALPRERVAEVFASADCFVFPSATDTAGNVVLEAQASGLPVVVSGSGGPRENMVTGRTGVVCHSDDPRDWAQKIAAMLVQSNHGRLSHEARMYALTRTWERALEPLYRAYREVRAGVEPALSPPRVFPASPQGSVLLVRSALAEPHRPCHEESLWSLLMLMLSAIAGTAALAADGSLRAMLIACFLIYGVGAGLTMAFDVRMYVRRWRLRTDDPRLTLATGWHDSRSRRHQTIAWEVWREEVPWMTLYFSIGVWTSLAMVLL